jgi:hypothetical protein
MSVSCVKWRQFLYVKTTLILTKMWNWHFQNSVKNILMCLVVLILYNTWPSNMYWLCSSVRIISIFVWGWLHRMWKKLAQHFNFSFRIDDIINIDFLYRIYPECVWRKCYHRHSIMSASFVDLYLEKDDEWACAVNYISTFLS